MTTTSDHKNLGLSVTSFGPVAKANIDLRPLTVFVGPSNTGKSYLAVLIYALHRFFNSYSRIDDYRPGYAWSTRPRPYGGPDIFFSEDDIAGIFAWAEETLYDLGTPKDDGGTLCELPESVAALVHPILNHVANLGDFLDREIARCYGIDRLSNLAQYPEDADPTISLHGNTTTEISRIDPIYEMHIANENLEIRALTPRNMPLRIDREYLSKHVEWEWLNYHESSPDERESFARDIIEVIASAVVSDTIDPLACPAHYLPADRTGVMHAHQVAVRGLIASASRTVLRQDSPMPVISGVLGDFLEQLVALASSSTRGKPEGDNEIARRMEQALLGGTVHVERSEIDYPSFVYRPDGWKKDLQLMNASSMVSELAPVVLYLRHAVQQGDLLIIEEPESHLHPAMQVEFVRQLSAAVKSGIRVLITTHSEWVLEELANLVRMSDLGEEDREGIESADLQLSPEEIGAWLFERGSEQSGSVVREIPLDLESGTFPAGFGLITEDLYNRWAEVSSRIQESSAQ